MAYEAAFAQIANKLLADPKFRARGQGSGAN
jgi:hypothetical protein